MIKLGIVGIGQIATSYIEMIVNHQIQDVELVALSSRNLSHMRSVVEKFKLSNVNLFQDYELMLKEGGIDAVIICTPHKMHPSMAKLALLNQVHVLVEKPLGVQTNEILELLEVSRSAPHLKCGVLYNRRMSKTYKKVKQLMDSGKIGRLKRVNWLITNLYRTDAYYKSSPWRGTYAFEGGGLLMNQASHQLDLINWLCGMPLSVYAICYNGVERQIEVENDVTIFMEFKNQATGQFIASTREFPGSNRLEIIGDSGQLIIQNDETIIFRELSINEVDYNECNTELFGKIPYKTHAYHIDDDHNDIQQAALINQFVFSILNDEDVACGIKEAYDTLQLTQASYLSSWRQSKVTLPLDKSEFDLMLQKKIGCMTKE